MKSSRLIILTLISLVFALSWYLWMRQEVYTADISKRILFPQSIGNLRSAALHKRKPMWLEGFDGRRVLIGLCFLCILQMAFYLHTRSLFLWSPTPASSYKWLEPGEKWPVTFTQLQISQKVKRKETNHKVQAVKHSTGEQKQAWVITI